MPRDFKIKNIISLFIGQKGQRDRLEVIDRFYWLVLLCSMMLVIIFLFYLSVLSNNSLSNRSKTLKILKTTPEEFRLPLIGFGTLEKCQLRLW